MNTKPIVSSGSVYKAVKATPAYNNFIAVLKQEEATLRDIYESEPASEYNRGRLKGVQYIINQLEGA